MFWALAQATPVLVFLLGILPFVLLRGEERPMQLIASTTTAAAKSAMSVVPSGGSTSSAQRRPTNVKSMVRALVTPVLVALAERSIQTVLPGNVSVMLPQQQQSYENNHVQTDLVMSTTVQSSSQQKQTTTKQHELWWTTKQLTRLAPNHPGRPIATATAKSKAVVPGRDPVWIDPRSQKSLKRR